MNIHLHLIYIYKYIYIYIYIYIFLVIFQSSVFCVYVELGLNDPVYSTKKKVTIKIYVVIVM